jgi:hypothetical protein
MIVWFLLFVCMSMSIFPSADAFAQRRAMVEIPSLGLQKREMVHTERASQSLLKYIFLATLLMMEPKIHSLSGYTPFDEIKKETIFVYIFHGWKRKMREENKNLIFFMFVHS